MTGEKFDEYGRRIMSSEPAARTIQPETRRENMFRNIMQQQRNQMAQFEQHAKQFGFETPTEFNDYDVEDDPIPPDMQSRWENEGDDYFEPDTHASGKPAEEATDEGEDPSTKGPEGGEEDRASVGSQQRKTLPEGKPSENAQIDLEEAIAKVKSAGLKIG